MFVNTIGQNIYDNFPCFQFIYYVLNSAQMEKYPRDTYRRCFVDGCNQLPTSALVGQILTSTEKTFQVQILYCPSHQNEAEKFAHNRYPHVRFNDQFNPTWLTWAQAKELKTRKS
jgi:hypothetical protein